MMMIFGMRTNVVVDKNKNKLTFKCYNYYVKKFRMYISNDIIIMLKKFIMYIIF